jgi:transposase
MAKECVSRWDMIVKEAEKGERIWVGVDVHKASYSVAILTSSGISHNFTTTSENIALIKQFTNRKIQVSCLAYEAGPTGFGLYRACNDAGIEAMVVAARCIPRLPGKTAKTDSLDCKNLVRLLAKGMLKGITIPSPEQEASRAKIRCRSSLAKDICRIKERIKSFLLAYGLPEPAGLKYWSRAGIEELKKMEMLPDLRFTLSSLLRQLQFLEDERSLLENEIKKNALPQDDILQSVPGVGVTTSSIFRSEIFDPRRFESAEQLTGYIGLAPVISQSGSCSGFARIVPCGQGRLRSVLVEAAWRLRSKEKWASDFYRRIYSHCGVPQKAITALARKLAIILWRLWMENRHYVSDYSTTAQTV